MLTSLGWREEDPRVKEFAAFLTKPIKASQLYNAVVGVFAGEIAARARRDREGMEEPALAEAVVERVRVSLSDHNATYEGTPLSFSLGFATGEQGSSLDDVLKQADDRMYQDKLSHAGRGH